ncbi:MAG: YcbK family protein [Kofleriaceae bacterium]|nr:YcbK family protein [Myxococcales bacterium]MCB9563915.1 YcbK family protein [Kofleriaceae bacterium]
MSPRPGAVAIGLALAAAVAAPGVAAADRAKIIDPAPAAPSSEPASKKDAEWAARLAPRKPLRQVDPDALVGKAPAEVISFYNQWTHEWIGVDVTDRGVDPELADRFLRCHFTNEPTDMDRRLLSTVLDAARHFKVDRVNVVSGFRAPKYNLMLRKKGHAVARDSQHTKGHAVDFWLPGVGTQALYRWAMSHQLGGVGLYPDSGFVHVDVGRKRTWTGE